MSVTMSNGETETMLDVILREMRLFKKDLTTQISEVKQEQTATLSLARL